MGFGIRSFFILGLMAFSTASYGASLSYDSDVPADLRAQLESDLAFLTSVQGKKSTPLHNEIFGSVSGRAYSKWFYSRVAEAGMSLCYEDNAVACVLSAWDNKMWFSPNYTKFSHPQIARIMVLVHEARHTERDEKFWPHVKCPKPFLNEQGKEITSIWTGAKLEGERACDDSAYGSYGAATVFLKNIAKYCKNCTEKVRMDAEIYGSDQLNRITNSVYKKEMTDDFKK